MKGTFLHPFDSRHPDHDHFVARAKKEAEKAAKGEPVSKVELNDDRSWVVFTTELGMYRVADAYGTAVVSKGWSSNLKSWYVRIGGK